MSVQNINRNRNFRIESLNIITDAETRGILGTCPSPTAANRLTLFYPNLTVYRIPTQIRFVNEMFLEHDFNDKTKIYNSYRFLRNEVVEIAEHQKTPELHALRNDVLLRIAFMSYLEALCLDETTVVVDYKGFDLLSPWLIDQLNKCDTENNIYTDSIRDLAAYHGISENNYYQELRMTVDSVGVTMLKNYAIWMKYSELLCKTPADRDSQMGVIKSARNELIVNSFV